VPTQDQRPKRDIGLAGSGNMQIREVVGITEEEFEEAYQNYMSERLAGNIDAMGNPLKGNYYDSSGNLVVRPDDGPDQPIIPMTTPEDPDEEDDDNDGRGTLYTCGRANKNYDLTNNAAFRFWNDNNGDINYISSYNGVGNAIKADEYNNRLIQIDGDRYSLLLIRDDLTLMGIGQSQHKQFSTTDNNGANRMVIFDDNLQPIESTNPID